MIVFDLRYVDKVRFSDLAQMVQLSEATVKEMYDAMAKAYEGAPRKGCVCQFVAGQKVYLCKQCQSRMAEYYGRWSTRMKQALSAVDGYNRETIRDL